MKSAPSPPADPAAPTAAEALARLGAALGRLEAVVARRVEADAAPDDRDTELALMEQDRARLAAALDAATARLAAFGSAAEALGQRVDRAIDAVEGVLGQEQGRGREPEEARR
ncbi:DUF4164 family protein [Methylobacterium radiodurans]|uniref:DUF4164 family protein n=1 Tax=Methylobacterium radiodurans TaxID=2202828 RepID=A0A2U8VLM0_9HYPH|nr:DUF4164 family protein [Methylobacterium radiodurans]AWN34549.1 hypothetical protein DK427_01335 [Methylobacterium radiodurans]